MILKTPHTAIFSGMTECGKTYKCLNMLVSNYKNHFEYIVIICPTISINKTYQSFPQLMNDKKVIKVDI